MDPNQQPDQNPIPPAPSPTPQQPQSVEPVAPQPQFQQPQPAPTPQPVFSPAAPAAPSNYDAPPQPTFDPNYLDSIAPTAARPSFFSGSFGKIFFIMIGIFVFAVSIIIALSGKDKTEDLQQTTVRVSNFVLLAQKEKPFIKSNNLSATNTSFALLMTNAKADGESLLKQAGVKKTQYSKKMVSNEKSLNDDLTQKFEDARLNAQLDSVYARKMSGETVKLIALFDTMAKKSQAKAIRDYAKKFSQNLDSIQKSFENYNDDGN